MTHPDGTDTQYEYDEYGRLTKEVLPWSGASGFTKGYDSAGRVTSVTNPLASTKTVQSRWTRQNTKGMRCVCDRRAC